jgi:hypothetical protein
VAVTAAGRSIVVWTSGGGHELRAATARRSHAFGRVQAVSIPGDSVELLIGGLVVRAGRQGGAGVVWNGGAGVMGSFLGRDGLFGTPLNLSRYDDGFERFLGFDRSGRSTVTWTDGDGSSEIVRGVSRRPDGAFTYPATLLRLPIGTTFGVPGGAIETDADGGQVAVWGIPAVTVARRRRGEPFGPPQELASGLLPNLAITPSGRAVVTWLADRDFVRSLHVARDGATGRFGPDQLLGACDLSPEVAVDEGGTAAVAWLHDGQVKLSVARATGPFATPVVVADQAQLGFIGETHQSLALARRGEFVVAFLQGDRARVAVYR